LSFKVVDRPPDDVHRARSGNLGVGLDVRDQQLRRAKIRRDRLTQSFGQVRRKQAGMLRAGGIDDQVGLCDGGGEPRVEPGPQAARAERSGRAIASQTLQRLDFLCGQARGQQVDIADPVVPRGVDDVGFAREDAAIDIERDQVRVGAVRDVLDQPRREPRRARRSRPPPG
jgi:hypothetical protein